MSHFDFEVTRERKPRSDRSRAVRLTLLFCVIAAVTALIIYFLIPEKESVPSIIQEDATVEKNSVPDEIIDPQNRADQSVKSDPSAVSSTDSPADGNGGSSENQSDNAVTAEQQGNTALQTENSSDSKENTLHSATGKGENSAKFDPSVQELFNFTDKLRTMLANGSWKESDFAVAHTVLGGDRLSLLAAKYHNTRIFVNRFNDLDADSTIRINQKLYFLRADSWQIVISRKESTLQLNRIVGGQAIPFALFHCRINAKGFPQDLVVNSHQYKPRYSGDHGTRFEHGSPQNPYGEYLLALAEAKNPAKPVYYLSIFDCKDQQSETIPLKNGATILNNEDISLLYTLVPNGTTVKIVE